MKKSHTIYLCVLLFTILSVPVFGNSGEGDKDPKNFNNQLTLDVQFLGIGVGYKRRVYNNLFVGIEAGAGAALNIWLSKAPNAIAGSNYTAEIYHFGIMSTYYIISNLQLELGLQQTGYLFDEQKTQKSRSIVLGTFIGGEKMQLGIRTTFGSIEGAEYHMGLPIKKRRTFSYITLLILRLHLNKW